MPWTDNVAPRVAASRPRGRRRHLAAAWLTALAAWEKCRTWTRILRRAVLSGEPLASALRACACASS